MSFNNNNSNSNGSDELCTTHVIQSSQTSDTNTIMTDSNASTVESVADEPIFIAATVNKATNNSNINSSYFTSLHGHFKWEAGDH